MVLPFQDKRPKIDPSAFIAENALIIGDVEIGPEANIWFYSIVRGDGQYIRIGAKCSVQDACVLHVGAGYPTIIEDEVSLGHRVVLDGCRIGKGSLIGIGSVILQGAEIGEGSIIGAGSLVAPRSVIPPGMLALGTPARPVRRLREEDYAMVHHVMDDYLNLKEIYRSLPQFNGGAGGEG